MSSIEFQDDPWGRPWCEAPRRRPLVHPQPLGGRIKGILAMLIAALLFALGASAARYASDGLSPLALVFWTNLFSFLIVAAWTGLRRPPGGLATRRWPLHLLRALFTCGALLAYFHAIAHIPFANAVVLQSLGPVLVPFLTLLALRRLAERSVWLGVLISFAGAALIIQPGPLGLSAGTISALLAALGGAAAALVIGVLSETEQAQRQMIYFAGFALLLSALPLPWAWQWPRAEDWLPVALTAAFTIAGQYCYALAFTLARSEKVNVWSYMSIVFAAVIGVVAWREPILAVTVIGACLIVAGAHLASRERRG